VRVSIFAMELNLQQRVCIKFCVKNGFNGAKTLEMLEKCFVEAWLNANLYKSWIRQVASDNTIYYCNICNKSFSCSASHVSRHVDSACHKNNIKENIIDNNNKKKKREIEDSDNNGWI